MEPNKDIFNLASESPHLATSEIWQRSRRRKDRRIWPRWSVSSPGTRRQTSRWSFLKKIPFLRNPTPKRSCPTRRSCRALEPEIYIDF